MNLEADRSLLQSIIDDPSGGCMRWGMCEAPAKEAKDE
jgi:hypothetical protein